MFIFFESSDLFLFEYVPRILFYLSGFSLCPGSCLRTGFVPDPKIGGRGGWGSRSEGKRPVRDYFMTSWGQLSPRIPLSTCLSDRPSDTLSPIMIIMKEAQTRNSSFWPIHSLKFFRSTLPSGRDGCRHHWTLPFGCATPLWTQWRLMVRLVLTCPTADPFVRLVTGHNYP